LNEHWTESQHVTDEPRRAALVEEGGVLVAVGETPVDDDVIFALIEAGRK
jgi:hypothetical protein